MRPAGAVATLLFLFGLFVVPDIRGAEPRDEGESRPILLAHYMPWFASREVSGKWGWHWTMDRFDPEKIDPRGEREIASHDYPLAGPYDSTDPHLLEYHVLLMKAAGIDGVIVDWYGIADHYDYAFCHRATGALIPWLEKAGLRFAICYEDQTLPHLVDARVVEAGEEVKHGREVIDWLSANWFSRESYLELEGRPLLLVFGPQHFLDEAAWKSIFAGLPVEPLLHTLPHLADRAGAGGSFAWVPVTGGKEVPRANWKRYLEETYARRTAGKHSVIAAAFPGFRDIYERSYGFLSTGRDGTTFRETLDLAFESGAPVVQLVTWNDHGEGTAVEPTRDHGFRYLEMIRKKTGTETAPGHLELPLELYRLRKKSPTGGRARLDRAAELMFASRFGEAAVLLGK